MRLWNWIKDHRTQSVIALVALVVGILALVRDLTDFRLDGHPDLSPGPDLDQAQPARPAVRRGPTDLRMVGGKPNEVETEVDLDSLASNWGVNSCAARCDINFRGSPVGVEEAYGQMAKAEDADHHNCDTATAYGYILSPAEAKVGAQACVLTDEGRLAALVVKQARKSDPKHVESILFEVTVWEK